MDGQEIAVKRLARSSPQGLVELKNEVFCGLLMAGGNSFDLWQKDVFFLAAEEVQESADTMESMYRMWLLSHSDGFNFDDSYDLRRDLHAALGTAKWQLEAFERALHESFNGYEDIA